MTGVQTCALPISVKADSQLFIGDQAVTKEQLAASLDLATNANKDTTIFFQADKSVDYETMMDVMNALRQSGYLKIGLVGMEAAASK